MADNQNGLRNRPYVSETECSDCFAVGVANPELRETAFGYVQLNWGKSVSHFLARLSLI